MAHGSLCLFAPNSAVCFNIVKGSCILQLRRLEITKLLQNLCHSLNNHVFWEVLDLLVPSSKAVLFRLAYARR